MSSRGELRQTAATKSVRVRFGRPGSSSAILSAAVAIACIHAPATSRAATADEATVTVGTPAIISADINAQTNYYSIINNLVGADRFYNAGYFGTNTMIANVEAGHVWNGQESLTNVTSYVSNAPIDHVAPQYDYHATMVGFVMVGLGPLTPQGYYYYQFGMAPGAALTSTAIATDWVGTQGQFDITSSTLVYGYKTVMQDGVARQIFPGISIVKPVDVVNSSWGFEDSTGSEQPTMILDALTYVNHQTVCVAAGNHESGTAQVGGPASGFNTISVGALGDDLSQPPYNTLASFSNTGPNDFYNPVAQKTIFGVRAAVSIVAPGESLILAAYTGATGSNLSGTLFDTSSIPSDQLNQLYFFGASGTSFASPTVAGGAALLVDAGYVNFGGDHSVDGRVIKAVLLNSATKTPGWTNHTTLVNGVLTTTQGLDWNTGAGALNLNRGYDQYLSGTTDIPGLIGGTVHTLGWDYGHVAKEAPNDYLLDTPLQQGDTFTATLSWFVATHFNANATAHPDTDSFSVADLHASYFDQLDLQVWRVINGLLTNLIADSTSPYNNLDHLYFQIPQDGLYAIRVSWLGTTYDVDGSSPQADDYGLAWSDIAVPEPATSVLLMGGVISMVNRRRRCAATNHPR